MLGELSAALLALISGYGEEKGTSFTAEEAYQIIQKIEGFGYTQEDIEEFSQNKFNYLAGANLIGEERVEAFGGEATDDQNEAENSASPSPRKVSDVSVKEHGSFQVVSVINDFETDDGLRGVRVKERVNWNKDPQCRGNDVLAVAYSDLFHLREDGRPSNPDVTVRFQYDHTHIHQVSGPGIETIDENTYTHHDFSYHGENAMNFVHIEVGDYVGFRIELPSDFSASGNQRGYSYNYVDTYTNFYLSIETWFEPVLTTPLRGADFSTYYGHETVALEFAWEGLKLSTSAPYVSMSATLSFGTKYDSVGTFFTLNFEYGGC